MSKISGILRANNGKPFIELADGSRHFEGERIWDGYLTHWADRHVHARTVPQKDYQTNRPIVLIWPQIDPVTSCVELYYNEKLSQYWESMMGHIALNVNGLIFNFSNLLNENEISSPEEYFYRPALGEFAPLPGKGKWGFDESNRPYYDKFGRLFMRSIHVLRIEGLDLVAMENQMRASLEQIHASPKDPRIYKLDQLVVPECPRSAPTRLTNIRNYFRSNLKYEAAGG
ncbi:MAG: hypothetical protein K8S54_04185 [Spirochaetia bacterium]|nr:hypothetical protein [Spirochaetia bacterium]